MNRRKLLKAISYLAAALITPFGFAAKSEKRVTIQQSADEFDGTLPERGEGVCSRCHKTFKEHSYQELEHCCLKNREHCLKNGGPKTDKEWEEFDRELNEVEREMFERSDRMEKERRERYAHKPGSERCICDQCFEKHLDKLERERVELDKRVEEALKKVYAHKPGYEKWCICDQCSERRKKEGK